MRERIGFVIAVIGVLTIVAIILYWLFCIHWTIGILGVGLLIFIIAVALIYSDDESLDN